MSELRSIGLIAGNGQFPLMFARGARKAGLRVIALALKGEAEPSIEGEVDFFMWLHLGQFGKAIKVFKEQGVCQAALVGGVGKLNAFRNARPDWLMLKMLSRLRHFNDDGLLRAVAQTFEENGVSVIPSTQYLSEILAPEGVLTKRSPDSDEEQDIVLGLQVAEAIGRADVGQTVVTHRGNVIAVEASEGTDACIARAGNLAGPGIVVVKRCKPQQDKRFDLPAIGPKTIETLALVKGAVLAVEAKNTVLLDAERLVKTADEAGICIVAMTP